MTAPNELSFLPDDYLEQKWKRRANVVCALLALLTAGVIGAGFYWMRTHHNKIEAHFQDVDTQYVDAARKIEQVKKMHEQQREVVQHAELAAALVEKVPRSNILAEITNSLPPGVSLVDLDMTSRVRVASTPVGGSSFEQHKAAIQGQNNESSLAAKPPQYDVNLKIGGIAQNDSQVAQLISRLSHSNLFQDVNLIVTDSWVNPKSDPQKSDDSREVLRRWQIEMALNPQAEVRDDKTAAIELRK